MPVDLDTFLVALYTIVDELYQREIAPDRPVRRGRRPELSDSEVLTLVVCQQWHGASERAFLRKIREPWRTYFPRLLDCGAFNRRARDLAGALTRLVPLVAAELGAALAPYQVVDGVAMPLARRCRGIRHRLFGDEAGIGKGDSDKDWYFGCKVLLSCAPSGAITGFVAGPADTEERWLAEAWACWRDEPTARPWDGTYHELPPSHKRGGRHRGPTGPIWPRDGAGRPTWAPAIADRGFRGEHWQGHWWADYGVLVRTEDAYDAPAPADADPTDVALAKARAQAARALHHSHRQIIETVNGRLVDVLHLHFPKARSLWGLRTRLAAKLLAFNLGIRLNILLGRQPLAHATLWPA
jgi:hypothetical protein